LDIKNSAETKLFRHYFSPQKQSIKNQSMKNTTKIFVLLLLTVIASSCFKKIKEDLTPSGSASITANGTTVDLGTPTGVTLLGIVTVEALKNKNGFTLVLNKSDIKPGKTYDLKSSTGVFTFLNDGTYYVPNTGTLEITKFTDNKIVEGKFNFEGAAVGSVSKRMTATGTFSVSIIL
jgi:branched-subunit amino acid transport protein AzlD